MRYRTGSKAVVVNGKSYKFTTKENKDGTVSIIADELLPFKMPAGASIDRIRRQLRFSYAKRDERQSPP